MSLFLGLLKILYPVVLAVLPGSTWLRTTLQMCAALFARVVRAATPHICAAIFTNSVGEANVASNLLISVTISLVSVSIGVLVFLSNKETGAYLVYNRFLRGEMRLCVNPSKHSLLNMSDGGDVGDVEARK